MRQLLKMKLPLRSCEATKYGKSMKMLDVRLEMLDEGLGKLKSKTQINIYFEEKKKVKLELCPVVTKYW